MVRRRRAGGVKCTALNNYQFNSTSRNKYGGNLPKTLQKCLQNQDSPEVVDISVSRPGHYEIA
jgi:hypothetical protein